MNCYHYGSHWILRIRRWDQERYQAFIDSDTTGMMIELATGDGGHIFGRVQPADTQIADIDACNGMVELVNGEEMQAVLSDFAARNSLDPIPEAYEKGRQLRLAAFFVTAYRCPGTR